MHNDNDKDRIFFALPLPDDAKERLGAEMSRLRQHVRFQKWVAPDDLHITLAFIGDADRRASDAMARSAADGVSGFGAFRLGTSGIGAFGNPRSPRILWTGVNGDRERLDKLYRFVVDALAPHGFAPESRPYNPHVTIARRCLDASGFRLPDPAALPETEWIADRLVLYRTRMGRTPMYEAMHAIPFDA